MFVKKTCHFLGFEGAPGLNPGKFSLRKGPEEAKGSQLYPSGGAWLRGGSS